MDIFFLFTPEKLVITVWNKATIDWEFKMEMSSIPTSMIVTVKTTVVCCFSQVLENVLDRIKISKICWKESSLKVI